MTGRLATDRESGFALIEVLVAFAIVSLCLASLYTAIGGHARQMAIADLHRQTLAYARTQLETFGESVSAQTSPLAGDYPNGTRWRMSIHDIAVGDRTTDLPMRPYLVVLQVFDRAGHQVVALDSVKMLAVAR